MNLEEIKEWVKSWSVKHPLRFVKKFWLENELRNKTKICDEYFIWITEKQVYRKELPMRWKIYYNDINIIPICKYCDNKVAFLRDENNFSDICNSKQCCVLKASKSNKWKKRNIIKKEHNEEEYINRMLKSSPKCVFRFIRNLDDVIKLFDAWKYKYIKFVIAKSEKLKKELFHKTQGLIVDKNINWQYEDLIRWKCLYENISIIPICKYCNNQAKFSYVNQDFLDICWWTKCKTQKHKDNIKDVYGVDNISQIEWVSEKISKWHLEAMNNKYIFDNIKILKSDWRYKYIFCEKHNQEFKVLHSTIKNSKHTWVSPCPMCLCEAHKIRWLNEENMVRLFLLNLWIKVEKKRFKIDDKVFEIDMYLPDYNIWIEYNGSYWHSWDKTRHRIKKDFFEKLGIHLIHIYSHLWKNHTEQYKMIIKSKLWLLDKLYARKLQVKLISYNDCKTICNKYHLQWAKQIWNMNVWLYHWDDLVSTISFKKIQWKRELLRYVSKYNIIWWFQKMFKFALNNFIDWDIYSWLDYDLGNSKNNVYLRNGFEYQKQSDPSYWWVKKSANEQYYYRTACQKKYIAIKFPEVYDNNLTEFDMMYKLWYLPVYNSWNKLYKFSLEKQI